METLPSRIIPLLCRTILDPDGNAPSTALPNCFVPAWTQLETPPKTLQDLEKPTVLATSARTSPTSMRQVCTCVRTTVDDVVLEETTRQGTTSGRCPGGNRSLLAPPVDGVLVETAKRNPVRIALAGTIRTTLGSQPHVSTMSWPCTWHRGGSSRVGWTA